LFILEDSSLMRYFMQKMPFEAVNGESHGVNAQIDSVLNPCSLIHKPCPFIVHFVKVGLDVS